jgi:hypothetical protein
LESSTTKGVGEVERKPRRVDPRDGRAIESEEESSTEVTEEEEEDFGEEAKSSQVVNHLPSADLLSPSMLP